jgi:pimeloyl-ACP methyl ester carboxylesterase
MKIVSKKTGTIKSFDGTRIYYELRGQGPTLVMAYGIGCLINHWQNQIRHFSSSFQTLVFDYRGHHQSDAPEDHDTLTVPGLAQDLICLMDGLGIDSASFLGHSFGCPVVLHAASLRPDLFKNLILINGFAKNPLASMFGNNLAFDTFKWVRRAHGFLPSTISYLWKNAVNNPAAIQLSAILGGFNLNVTQLKDVEIYARGISTMDLDIFIKLFENMLSYDATEILPKIQTPTLIIGGEKDSVTPPKFQYDMKEQIVNSEIQIVPYGSHCTQLDFPDYVHLLVERFIAQRSR